MIRTHAMQRKLILTILAKKNRLKAGSLQIQSVRCWKSLNGFRLQIAKE